MADTGLLQAFGLDPSGIEAAVNGRTASYGAMVSNLLVDGAAADRFAGRSALSRDDAAAMRLAMRLRAMPDLSVEWILSNLVSDRCQVPALADALRGLGRLSEAERLSGMDIPPFPVNGNDLIGKGLAQGPDVGDMLRDLRRRWVTSGFSLRREDLLGDALQAETCSP
jgi:hypothetical protein